MIPHRPQSFAHFVSLHSRGHFVITAPFIPTLTFQVERGASRLVANGKVSTAIGDELVKVIQSRYRTLPAPEFWAIGGLSSGAWGAVNIGLHHLDHFSILLSHSGYFTDTSGAQNSPLEFVKTLTPDQRQELRIYMDVGKKDSGFYLTQNQRFERELDRLKISNEANEFPGEHSWRYWRQHLADSLAFVGKQWMEQENNSAG